MRKIFLLLILLLTLSTSIFSSGSKESDNNYTLRVYANIGMSNPAKRIVEAFEEKNNYKVDLTLANFGQLLSQINISEVGDVFISASRDDLEELKDSVDSISSIALHKISLAVQKGNPKGLTSIQDLRRSDVTLVVGNSSTATGIVTDKILTDLNLSDKVNIIARQTTAATIYTVLERGEVDAIINWKNNIGKEAEIIDPESTDKYTQTISAAGLKYSKNIDAQKAFIDFLQSEEAMIIWESEGYGRL